MEKCKICGVHIQSGAIVCPQKNENGELCHVCFKCCTECRFHKSGGITIETCIYKARLNKWTVINFNFWASPLRAKELYEMLSVEKMTDYGLKERYKQLYERYKEKRLYSEARQGLSEMLYVLSKEIERRCLF